MMGARRPAAEEIATLAVAKDLASADIVQSGAETSGPMPLWPGGAP